MTIVEAILLGIVQGATEFLPVSSSGHLVIAQSMLGVEIPGVFFEVAVHVATVVSVLAVYRARVGSLAAGVVAGDADALRYVGYLVLASVPAGIVGVALNDVLVSLFDAPIVVGFALLVTGGFLWSVRAKQSVVGSPTRIAAAVALVIGLGQAVAIVPGISRSGITVVIALWFGVEAREAAAFSFLLSVPAIGGAALLSLPEALAGPPGISGVALASAAVAAAVTGVLAIFTFVKMLNRGTFHSFAPYCWVVGGGFIAYLVL